MHPLAPFCMELDRAAQALEEGWHLPWAPFTPVDSIWSHPLLRQLWNLDAESVLSLLPYASTHRSFAIRGAFAHLCGERRFAFAQSFLTPRLVNDPSVLVRATAAMALQTLGTEAALEPLLDTRDGEHSLVKKTVVRAFGLARDARAIPLLTRWVGRAAEDDELRANAAEAFGQMQDEAAIPVLSRMLFDRALSARVQVLAASALGAIGGPEAYELLLKAVQSTLRHDLRVAAMAALGATQDARASLTLHALLDHEGERSPESEAACLQGLVCLQDEGAFLRFTQRLSEERGAALLPYLRAALSIGRDRDLEAHLSPHADDEDGRVRELVRALLVARAQHRSHTALPS